MSQILSKEIAGRHGDSATAQASSLTFLNLVEVEEQARHVLTKMAYDYYSTGSDTCSTVVENRTCFARYKLLPRMLRNVSRVDTSHEVFGIRSSMPVWVAPMAMHGLADPQGREVATCRAAAASAVPFTFSTVATASFEEIQVTGHSAAIFQLYVIRNRDVVRRWVTEAEVRGFKALMVTVDAQRLGNREADERNKFTLPAGLALRNLEYLSTGSTAQARDSADGSGLMRLFAAEIDDSLTWDFIPWLRSITKLPIIAKGLLSPDDAELAVQYGVDGIVVSNHGGRQLDFAPSGLEMLPAVVAAVRGRVPVLVDGGIRRGTDVIKASMEALALGASAVLLGRPVLYGLAVGRQAGVERVLQLLRKEIELSMALTGCACLRDIGPQLLLPPSRM
ncbi:hypothetical protein VOLCADRAFT_56216 [Volvox carteri f. nagariensis]|uniref:FMN hydroxy acid dehydrogenase domain-containing protein n=1 Tax=Volvox carteri f. nagariensis TaxID=3068 RepID=D8TK69_VOLCA|nr:uncharacterized protein VOLCADRAFT_56216 [Volvox carteri f. nagariensis]EFJ52009.1 hypothetical protein VOLCADRAFT_56216 [Volvox carteri f. nagariensis]|eukprot:XP_002946783.1 hypothetical protein VOLCADRAFT_56216 [Volvox carteri f. nagariensis]